LAKEARVCGQLLKERRPERPAAAVSPAVSANEHIDDLVAEGCLVKYRHRGGDQLTGINDKLASLKSRAAGWRPPVGNGAARPAFCCRHKALETHTKAPSRFEDRRQRFVLAQIAGPGKRPFDEQESPVATGSANWVKVL
jgi:hypothetical protein